MKLFLISFATMVVSTVAFAPLTKTRAAFYRAIPSGPSGVGPQFSTSPSVKTTAEKSSDAADALKTLEKSLNSTLVAKGDEFYKLVNGSLASAKITDAKKINDGMEVKTEYLTEFSLEKVALLVANAIKVAAAAMTSGGTAPAVSPQAIAAYVDLVNAVAEAAKSGSSASASLSFSETRLAPGVFGYVYATTSSLKDERLFGTEAVTSTAIFYQIVESIQELQKEVQFDLAVVEAQTLLHMKTNQASLADRLAKQEITIDDWMTLDEKYSQSIKGIQSRLDSYGWENHRLRTTLLVRHDFAAKAKVVRNAVALMEDTGPGYALAVNKARLAEGYYD